MSWKLPSRFVMDWILDRYDFNILQQSLSVA